MLFLYRDVLAIALGDIPPVVRARTPERLPVVLSRPEVAALLEHLNGTERLVVVLLYARGCGWKNASRFGSRISISIVIRSSCDKGRAGRIG